MVDQAVSSLTNFTAAVLVARSVSSRTFGAFSIAFLVYVSVVSLTRALISNPLAIRFSTRVDQRDEVSAAAGAAVVCGFAAAVAVLIAAWLIGGATGIALGVMGALLPALVLQDAWRFALFTMGEPRRAVVNDLVWAAVQVVLIIGVVAVGAADIGPLTGAWASGALVSAGLGAAQTGAVPAAGQALAYLRRHFALGWRFACEVIFRTGSSTLTMLFLGVVLGTTGVGGVRGGQTLFGPFAVGLMGVMSGGIAEGSRLLARAPHRTLRVLSLLSGALLVLSFAWSSVLMVMPDTWGRALLGETWLQARDVILPFAFQTAGIGALSGAMLGLRVVSAASETMRLRAMTGVATVVCGVGGAAAWGAPGGVWGLALGSWANAVGAWWLLTRLARTPGSAFATAQDRDDLGSALAGQVPAAPGAMGADG